MKAILVLDMPEVCGVCPLCQPDNERNICYCSKTMTDIKLEEKPDWCPIKPIPFKRKSMVEWVDTNIKSYDLTEYDKGWNDCIEFLEGEDND